ncbi:S-adenosyl-L-methionine-dependent methyltransferase [Lophiotrema nucula]|uniref:S-adenosyl-L-methionine-dependent methyltransferase n=1 Tax=Lophiotrema nucula TaxID=690887 RepID=A0A6A5ZD15_9PLEO|nr:S-adenosyl-L-methionine-dependent methyltransferase [Lophiotrema nucula]
MSDKLIHSPISTSPTKILDVGCGTGIVTVTLAKQWRSAEAIGLDLTPVPKIPGRQLPSNVSFVQGNVLDLGKPGQEKVTNGEIDLIYSRLLLAGMSDWPKYIKTAALLLKPGDGWLEVHDLDWIWYDGSGKPISNDWGWLRLIDSECQKRGLEIECGSRAPKYMEQAGLVDIQTVAYEWRNSSAEDEKDDFMKRFSEYTRIEMPKLIFGFLEMLIEGKGHAKEEVEAWRRQIKTDLAPEKGKHWKFYITYGRRPD